MKPVSIIICHYSHVDDFGGERAVDEPMTRSEIFKRSLESLIANTKYPAEVIVVDNGGNPDDSEYILGHVRDGNVNTYIRNKENMYFGYAWNQGARIATSDYILFTCNDIEYFPNWLDKTMKPLLSSPDEKLIATPLITRDKDQNKFRRGVTSDGYRLNSLAGSACFAIRKEFFSELGEFTTHRVAGTHWHQRMRRSGFTVIAPPENMAHHLGEKGGVNFNKDIKVRTTLLDGTVVDFSYE